MNSFQEDHLRILERSRDRWGMIAGSMIRLVMGAIKMMGSSLGLSDSAHMVQDSPNHDKNDFVTVIQDPTSGRGDRHAPCFRPGWVETPLSRYDRTEHELGPEHVQTGVQQTKMIHMIR